MEYGELLNTEKPISLSVILYHNKHAGLTTRFQAKNLYKSIFVLSRSRDM